MLPELGAKTLGSEWISMELDTDIYGYRAFNEMDEELGIIQDYIFDEHGRLRYLVLETGFWIFSKKVLVPSGLCRVNDAQRNVVLVGLTRELIGNLPNFENIDALDVNYEATLLSDYSEVSKLSVGENASFFRPPERLQVLEDRLLDELPTLSFRSRQPSQLTSTHYPYGQEYKS